MTEVLSPGTVMFKWQDGDSPSRLVELQRDFNQFEEQMRTENSQSLDFCRQLSPNTPKSVASPHSPPTSAKSAGARSSASAKSTNKSEPTSPGVVPSSFTSTRASQLLYAEPDQTLIFLDWDDTLFPTYELFQIWHLPSRPEEWPEVGSLCLDRQAILEIWRRVLHSFLSQACALSNRVSIVTNSNRPWVSDCIKHFCPGLQSLFDRPEIHIVYAREFAQRRRRNSFQSSMQNLFPVMFNQNTSAKEQTPEEHQSAMTSSKFLAIQSEVKEFYSRYKGQTWKNLLSIGDMPFERDALQEVTFTRIGPATEVVRTKTITVTPNPTISLMVVGLRFRTLLLP